MGKLFCILLFAVPLVSVSQNTIYQSHVDHYYRTGLELLDKEKFGAAQQSFGRYLELEKNDLKTIEAELYLALCGLYLYHPDAEVQLSKFIAAHPGYSELDVAFFNLGDFYFRNKSYRKSIEFLQQSDDNSLSPEQGEERTFKLGYAHFASKEFDLALPYFDQVKTKPGTYYSAANYYAGYIEYRQEQYSKALADLRRAEQSPAYKSVVPYLIVNVLNQQRRYDELIRYAENDIDFGLNLKNKSEIYLLLGESYFQKKSYSEAARNFDKYKTTGSKPPEDLAFRIGFTYLMTGQERESIDYFKRVAAKSDSLGQYASYYLGQLYLEVGNPEFASSAFHSASQMNFDPRVKQESEFQFGKINYEIGRFQLAITALQAFLKEYSASSYKSEASDLLSQAFLNTNDFQLAIEHIESLASMSPTVKEVYQQVTFKQGVDFYNQEKYSKAVEFFDKSLSQPISSDFVISSYYWRAEAFSAGNRYDQAIRSYKAINGVRNYQQNKYYLKSQYGLGYAHFNTQQYQKALDNFRLYVGDTKKPQGKAFFGDAVLRLADCQYALKQYELSLGNYLEVARNARQDQDYALYQTGVIYGIQGNVSSATQNLNRVVEEFPRSIYVDDAKFEIAQVNFQNGRYQAAEDGFSRLIASESQSPFLPYAFLKRGLARSNQDKLAGTIADYKIILDNYPESPAASGALLGLQEALGSQNSSAEFDQYLAKYKEVNPDDSSLEGVEYEAAKSLYFGQKYPEAIDRFQKYIAAYPATAAALEAKFYIAESFYRQNQSQEALDYYTQVIDGKRTNRTNRSINRVADLELARGNFDNALASFRRLGEGAENKKEEFNALIGQMKSHFYQSHYDSTVHYSQLILDKGDISSRIQNMALLFHGKVAHREGRLDQATDDFLTILNTAKDEAGAEAQYLLAEIFFQQQQHPQSLETLYDLNTNFSSYPLWRNKSFLLIADNFMAMDELFQAQETLKSIIENAADTATVSAAKFKLGEVIAMQEKVNFPEIDSVNEDGTEVIID